MDNIVYFPFSDELNTPKDKAEAYLYWESRQMNTDWPTNTTREK